MQAKSDARLELAHGGLQDQVGKLEVSMATTKADAELLRLKGEMGMLPPETTTTQEEEQETQTVRNIEV